MTEWPCLVLPYDKRYTVVWLSPATVRMVSNNGPPLPMPMQVPPGHMVQQIVDENGILTHVILSPQPPGMPPGPPMTVGYYGGPNGTPQQMYPSYNHQGYPPYAAQYPHHHAQPPHMHTMGTPHHLHTTPPPNQTCNSHTHSHIHTGTPHSHSPNEDGRKQRQKQRLQEKLQKRRETANYYCGQNHTQHAMSPRKANNLNGDTRKGEVQSGNSSSDDGQEVEEERKKIKQLLGEMSQPTVSNVESRSALICLSPPEFGHNHDIQSADFKYELQLSEKKDSKFKPVYNGEATEITLKDLRPCTEFFLKVSCIWNGIKGEPTEPISFKTDPCEPDPPPVPKLVSKSKTWLLVKWNAAADNGSRISSYFLEYDKGLGEHHFVEVYSGLPSLRQYKVTKLNASTRYLFRLAASNALGKSKYSETVCFYTSGSVPSQPDPPMCSEQFVKALTISWIRRPNDDEFTLQMEDVATGHGFLNVYNGQDLSYRIRNLRRNTEYKFRLQSSNEEGSSKWSDIVCYHTLPDRPSPPTKLQLKGKIHSHSFRVIWEPPRDNGGAEITNYILQIGDGCSYCTKHSGIDREYSCDDAQPGTTYHVHVACISAGGQSDWCDPLSITTQPVVPGPCLSPKLHGKPKATSLHLRWAPPSYEGGDAVSEYDVIMTNPDNTTREVYRGRECECVVAGLLPGRPYLFQVRPINKAGAGPWSDSLEVVSGPGVPDPPKMPAVSCRSPHCATITWEEPVNNGARITDYRLEWQQRTDTEFVQLYCGSALSYEVKGTLNPATSYSFRVQALNSAGAGPFSAIATCMTPPSSPGPVMSVRASATATSIHLVWKEPLNNGSPILSYNINVGEKLVMSVDNILDYVIDDLVPETTYRIRVQAVNEIGVGAFSSPVKVATHSLPPSPPSIECISMGSNTLKLKWGDGKNPDMVDYCLEMLRDNGSFHPIYHGRGQSHKVNKLNELTDYQFRIYAINEAGHGPHSDIYTFSTTKAPPPPVKSPHVCDIQLDSCTVEWPMIKPMGQDPILYTVQIQRLSAREHEYKQVYHGADTRCLIDRLLPQTDYQVRVCAVRQSVEEKGEHLTGAYSPGVRFVTLSPKPASTSTSETSTTSLTARIHEAPSLTDQQWAIIILIVFALCAVVIAILAQQIIAYTNGGGSFGAGSPSAGTTLIPDGSSKQ
ncbi:hypothetical protein LSH36_825g03009 [Paralvinella palmiformis]|uniref:Fibronectin type-III domain-containing protein n=1 Tax=Paralvinella palmiformis TaxID=53620 RepID=A0AAD9IZT3_9ANNE|nr:hypothetical protein LSH36_825g03009 [Paralvinella palmiformis]